MSYSIEKLPGEPIVVVEMGPVFDIGREWDALTAELAVLLDGQTEPVFHISDMRQVSPGMDDIIKVANSTTRTANAILKHPNIRENIAITTSAMFKLTFKGVNTATFGYLRISNFDTVDDALTHCRRMIDDEAHATTSN